MSRYFEYIGENNNVIIDDTSQHLMISRVLTLADCQQVDAKVEQDYVYTAYVQAYILQGISSNELVIAIRPKTEDDNISFAFQWHPAYSNNCVIIVHNRGSEAIFPEPKDVYIYLYTLKPNSDDKIGVEIFDSSGSKIFHSSNALLNIMHSEIIQENVDVYGNGLVNHPKFNFSTGNKKVAFASLSPWSNFEVQIFGFFDVALIVYYVAMCWGVDKKLIFHPQAAVDIYLYGYASLEAFNAFYVTSPFSHFMLIDVTNIPVPE